MANDAAFVPVGSPSGQTWVAEATGIIFVDMYGGEGGSGDADGATPGGPGGGGGRLVLVMYVQAGEVYYFHVGAAGPDGTNGVEPTTGDAGIYARGGEGSVGGGHGGGGTHMWKSGSPDEFVAAVGGGGGGSGGNSAFGPGAQGGAGGGWWGGYGFNWDGSYVDPQNWSAYPHVGQGGAGAYGDLGGGGLDEKYVNGQPVSGGDFSSLSEPRPSTGGQGNDYGAQIIGGGGGGGGGWAGGGGAPGPSTSSGTPTTGTGGGGGGSTGWSILVDSIIVSLQGIREGDGYVSINGATAIVDSPSLMRMVAW